MSVCVIGRKDKFFYHFGIMIDNNKVLHFASKTNDMFARDQQVKKESLEEFSNGRKVEIVYEVPRVREDIIETRAESYWGNNMKYSLRSNNCILFVLWCLHAKIRQEFGIVVQYYIKYCLLVIKNKIDMHFIFG